MNDLTSAGWLNSYQTLKGNCVDFHVEVLRYADPTRTDFHKEIDITLQHMANTFYQKPIYLALSGGLDSEYIGNSLIRNKIPFTPILMRIGTHNELELWYAEHWCKQNNIEPEYINADPLRLLNNIKTHLYSRWMTCNIGGLMNIFIADYVKKCYDGIMIAGSGDFTINGGDSFGTSGGDNDADLGEPVFYYWDIEIVLDHLRPGQHPRSTIGYFPETLNSWLQNYDINLTEQEAKSRMYDIPIRPKVDVFSMVPDWVKFFSDIKQFVQFTNHRAGTKAEATKWLTGV